MVTRICLAILCALLGSGITTVDGRTPPDTLTKVTGMQDGDISVTNSRSHQFKNPYVSELWMLGNKMTRVEDKFQTFGDRVDIKLDSLRKRATSLENDVLERVASVETDFSSRVSRLEDRLASVLLSKTTETELDEYQAIKAIKDDLADLTRSVEVLNESHTDLQECRLKNQQLTTNLSARISILEELGSPKREIGEMESLLNDSVSLSEENTLTEKKLRSDCSARISKLEDTVSLLLDSASPRSCLDTQRRVDQLALSFEALNATLVGLLEERPEAQVYDTPDNSFYCQNVSQALADTQLKLEEMTKKMQDLKDKQDSKIVSCERGMGTRANRAYQPYTITTDETIQRQILCDTKSEGGGWIVIQRRTKMDILFNRAWQTYKKGFGNLNGDFWLGNEAVHKLTNRQLYELRIEFQSRGTDYMALYKTFKLENEKQKYRIRLGSVSGNLGDSDHGLSYSNNMAFSTFDRDNDENSSGQCAGTGHGGWWFKNCYRSNLNAPWLVQYNRTTDVWNSGTKWMGATRTEMKIRPL